MASDINSLRQIASFEHCYSIESGSPTRIRLSGEQTVMKTHQAAESQLMELMATQGSHPEVLRIKQNLQCGASKYPAYFAALDVIRAALAKLPAGSWTTYSYAGCLRSHVIWKSDQQVNMRAFEKDSDLNGLRAYALQESLRVEIV